MKELKNQLRDEDNYRSVRSYVLRQARMSKLQHTAFEQLYDDYAIPVTDREVDLEQAFSRHRAAFGAESERRIGSHRDVILEIGFGMGRATVEIAANNPDSDYLGIEVHTPGVGKLLSEVHKRHLTNVMVIHGDAARIMRTMIGEDSLAGIHLFFPDPWPKKRHHKRRLVQPEFAALMKSRIREGGYLYAVTDWSDYAAWMLDVLESTPGFVNTATDFVPHQAWRPLTRFEEKGLLADRSIHELLFRVR